MKTYPTQSAKVQGLLAWCRNTTDNYPGVLVTNFTSSFKDGLAFCAIMHRYRPDLIDFHSLSPYDSLRNNQLAFSIGETIGIPDLLDAEDMATPERLSIITYLGCCHKVLKDLPCNGGPDVNRFSAKNSSKGSSGRKLQQQPSRAELLQGLLNWCKMTTDNYPGVNVTNFTSSFSDGLAFCAIMHRYRPDLIDFHSLSPYDSFENNQLAFSTGLKIGIPDLLEPQDMANPERLSIITYLGCCRQKLWKFPSKGGPNINRFSHKNSSNYSSSSRSSIRKILAQISQNEVLLAIRRFALSHTFY